MKRPRSLVVGSLNMDLSISMEALPQRGETILGGVLGRGEGGKGANQAVQAARLGGEVTMVGKVGKDPFGQELVAALSRCGIDTGRVLTSDKPTGTAVILLETQGGAQRQNRIIVAPGANMDWTPGDLAWLEREIAQFDMVLLQLEIPMEINCLVAETAKAAGVPVMLNPAPALPLPDRLLTSVCYLSPNEHEAAHLTGVTIAHSGDKVDTQAATAAAQALSHRGVENVIFTLGSGGAVLVDREGLYHSPCARVEEVKDPTAAGDSFVGAFCTGVSVGLSHRQALQFASYVAGLTVSRPGAQSSLPTLGQVLDFIRRGGCEDLPLGVLEALGVSQAGWNPWT